MKTAMARLFLYWFIVIGDYVSIEKMNSTIMGVKMGIKA